MKPDRIQPRHAAFVVGLLAFVIAGPAQSAIAQGANKRAASR